MGEPLPPPIFSGRGLIREFRGHFPIWVVYLTAVGMLHACLANFPAQGFAEAGLPRDLFSVTVVFPLAWFAWYFVLRIRRSKRKTPRWKATLALAALVLGIPLVILLFRRPFPFTSRQISDMFEVSSFVTSGLMAVHVLLTRGRRALALFFGPVLLFGLFLENAGIVMGFFREPGFRVYLPFFPAPLCTVLGWSLAFTVVISVIDRLAEWVPWLAPSRGVWTRVVTATALALCLDAQLDPLASMAGFLWQWNELLPRAFFGVPLVNFAAWLGAFSVFSFFVFRLRQRAGWSPGRMNRALFLRVPLACVLAWALCFVVMAAAEGGFDGPSYQILRAFAGRLLTP